MEGFEVDIELKNIEIKIPESMYAEIQKILRQHPEFGYECIDEFIWDSVRTNFLRLGV